MSSRLPFEFIRLFDGITWIPTIKGELSYDLLSNPDNLMGDRDKKLVHFKVFNGEHSGHYVIATSLCTFEDDYQKHKSRKCSSRCSNHPSKNKDNKECANKSYCTYHKKYNHTFRFIFIGTDSAAHNPYSGKIHIPEESGRILTGNLYILPQLGKKTDGRISTVLDKISHISDFVDEIIPRQITPFTEYDYELTDRYDRFPKLWKELTDCLEEAEKASESASKMTEGQSRFPRPMAKFNLLLKLNGILLIKNATSQNNTRYFKVSGNGNGETRKDTPMHRIFKTVASYVKFLFHKNYNHHDKNDSYTPVSNLSLISDEKDLEEVAMHQLKALLSPVIQLRRDLYNNTSVIF